MNLGIFKKVPLREIWKHEALDFTNWLAQADNLELLADELGMSIVNAQTEVSVGKFFVDILAEDDNDHKIIIENQLESTNHDHLGKIITYASGLEAETIIWIVSKAREEHEQAINWLNENTTKNANFFLIEIEAWKIDNSAPAPKFNIIAKPNDWAKTLRQSGGSNKITEIKLKQQEFWDKLSTFGQANSKQISSWRKPRPQHWFDISIGSGKAHVNATINSVKNKVSIDLYINNNKDLYYELERQKIDIENDLGCKLIWQELPNRKASMIGLSKNADFQNLDNENELLEWFVVNIDNISKTFRKFIK